MQSFFFRSNWQLTLYFFFILTYSRFYNTFFFTPWLRLLRCFTFVRKSFFQQVSIMLKRAVFFIVEVTIYVVFLLYGWLSNILIWSFTIQLSEFSSVNCVKMITNFYNLKKCSILMNFFKNFSIINKQVNLKYIITKISTLFQIKRPTTNFLHQNRSLSTWKLLLRSFPASSIYLNQSLEHTDALSLLHFSFLFCFYLIQNIRIPSKY